MSRDGGVGRGDPGVRRGRRICLRWECRDMMIFAIETGGWPLKSYMRGDADRGLLTCQFMRTRSPPPIYPETNDDFSSSPSNEPNDESDSGSPLQLHKFCFNASAATVLVSASNLSSRCERRCSEPEPTHTTASTDVRKERMESIWSTESDSNSHIVVACRARHGIASSAAEDSTRRNRAGRARCQPQ